MGSVELFLLCIAAVFLIGVVGELVFARTGVPDVVWLIVVGVFMGPVLGWSSATCSWTLRRSLAR